MKTDDDRLKELFRGYAASRKPLTRGGCPSPEAIARSFEPSASARKKRKIVDHVSGCPFCRDEFLMFLEIQKRDPARPEASSPRPPGRPLLWQIACVFLGLGLVTTSYFMFVHQKEISTMRQRLETGLVLLSPKVGQSLSGPLVFRWRGRQASEYYVLELFDDALLPVWASDRIRKPQVLLPVEIRSTLQPGRSYFWMVTAFSQGAKTDESPLGRFVIRD
jgi:hypothetical protein